MSKRMTETDMCMAQYITDFFGIEKISCEVMGDIMDCSVKRAGNIFRELSWDKEVVTVKTRAGNESQKTIFHKNGSHKHFGGNAATLARKKLAKMLVVDPDELKVVSW